MKKISVKYYPPALLIIWLIITGFTLTFSQDKGDDKAEIKRIFDLIESGISANNIGALSQYFGENTFLSLKKVNPGYFSVNQVHYVLKDFLSVNKPVSFRFNNIVNDTKQPYGTGLFVFSNKGRRDSAVIFVSLKKVDQSWIISQISIN